MTETSAAKNAPNTLSGKTAGSTFSPRGERWRRVVPFLLGVAVLLAIFAPLCIGAYPLPFGRAAEIALHLAWPGALPADPQWNQWDVRELTVVQVVRFPRVLLATLAGIGLGISGAALQGIMRNPLVGPDLVGVTSGAAFGGVVAMLLDWPPAGIVGAAFCCVLGALLLTFGLAKTVRNNGGSGGMALILAGIFVGAFFIALVGLIQFLAPDHKLPAMVYWMLGSFVGADSRKVLTIAVPTLAGGAVLMLLRWRLNLLSLGDADAASLGVDVRRLRWMMIALVSLIVAAQVSVSGLIGWVGLVVPHLARMLVGPDYRRLLPASALLGGMFVLGLDDIARAVLEAEMPVGVLSALVGTPAVCLLFWKMQTRGWNEQ